MDARFRFGGLVSLPEYEFKGTEMAHATPIPKTEWGLGLAVKSMVELSDNTPVLVDVLPRRREIPYYAYAGTRDRIKLTRMQDMHIRPSIRSCAFALGVKGAIYFEVNQVRNSLPEVPWNFFSKIRTWRWDCNSRPYLQKYFSDYMFGRMHKTLKRTGKNIPINKYIGCLTLLNALEQRPDIPDKLKEWNINGVITKPLVFTIRKKGISVWW